MSEGLSNITEENSGGSLRGNVIISETENSNNRSNFFSRFFPLDLFVDVIIDFHNHFGDFDNVLDFVPNSVHPSFFGCETFFDFCDPSFSFFESRLTSF